MIPRLLLFNEIQDDAAVSENMFLINWLFRKWVDLLSDTG